MVASVNTGECYKFHGGILTKNGYTWYQLQSVGGHVSVIEAFHYENMPIQIYRRFHLQKLKKFSDKNSDIFCISAQNIDCGYSLEPPRRGGSNGYPQSMLFSKLRKIMYTPVNPSFTI